MVKLNKLITRAASVCECELLDIYTAFDSSDRRLVNASAGSGLSISGLDPHPNAEGHAFIASLLSGKWHELNENGSGNNDEEN